MFIFPESFHSVTFVGVCSKQTFSFSYIRRIKKEARLHQQHYSTSFILVFKINVHLHILALSTNCSSWDLQLLHIFDNVLINFSAPEPLHHWLSQRTTQCYCCPYTITNNIYVVPVLNVVKLKSTCKGSEVLKKCYTNQDTNGR